jgi:hypothetical protein
MYIGTIGRILHDNLGVESRHTMKGNIMTFNRHTIKRLKSQLNSKIQVKDMKAMNIMKAYEGGDTSDSEREIDIDSDISERENMTPPVQLPSLPSYPSYCDICGEPLPPEQFYAKLHRCEGTN